LRSPFARTRSPSCAIAMPRSASAAASSRSATRFSAPMGSPAASARAAALISESIEIASHLSLSLDGGPGLHSFQQDVHSRGTHKTKGRRTMTQQVHHGIGTREEWLAARLELLEAEKELTRRSDELAQRRQKLPWVQIDTPYRFETEQG